MTLGDLISAIKTKAGSMFESSNDTTATQNLPALQARAPRLLLHAAALQLVHPASGEILALESQVPF